MKEIVVSGDFEILVYVRNDVQPGEPVEGQPDENVNPVPEEPDDIDQRTMTIVKAVVKESKKHVILWEFYKYNDAPESQGGPFIMLRHPVLMSDRTFISDGDNVLVVNTAIRIDGGSVAYEVMAYGALSNLDRKELDGKKLFIKKSEFS